MNLCTMENDCHFVCSRGLLKSCTFHSSNPNSSCANDCLHLKQMLMQGKMHDGMSIYVCSDALSRFVLNVLPHIKHTFVLVTGDSDMCVPMEALGPSETKALVNNPHLLKWFTQNMQVLYHEKMVQLPIGLDYHTIANDPIHIWNTDGDKSDPMFQEGALIEFRERMKPFHERIPLIYVNFSINNDKFKQRKCSLDEIPNNLLEMNQTFSKRTTVWKNVIQFTFVLSPFGMGMDCHRTWEALCLGGIPILKAPIFKSMFEDLPVLIVNEWSEITRELLDETIHSFKTKEFKYEKLTLKYWTDMINTNPPPPPLPPP